MFPVTSLTCVFGLNHLKRITLDINKLQVMEVGLVAPGCLLYVQNQYLNIKHNTLIQFSNANYDNQIIQRTVDSESIV